MELDELQTREAVGEDPQNRKAAMKKAVGYLSRREHSCYEIGEKLTRSGFVVEIAADIVDDLRHQGLVSDHRFTEAYIRYRGSKGFGPVRIQMELGKKGISSSLVHAALMREQRNWAERATCVRIKKYGSDSPGDFKERARQARFLQYRGFTNDQIQQAMNSGG